MHIKVAGIAIYMECIKAMSTFRLNHQKESKEQSMIQKIYHLEYIQNIYNGL